MTTDSVMDAIGGGAAAASPLWLQYIEGAGALYLAVAGAVLVTIRIGIAIRKWRNLQ